MMSIDRCPRSLRVFFYALPSRPLPGPVPPSRDDGSGDRSESGRVKTHPRRSPGAPGRAVIARPWGGSGGVATGTLKNCSMIRSGG